MFTTILSMRKIARQVRNLQINRQHWLNYTGNETLGHQVRKFRLEEVDQILFKFLKHNLEFSSYDPQQCRELSKELCVELKDVVKSIKYPRYNLVSMVTIGQKDKQVITISSWSLINKDMDTYSSVYYTNGSLFAVAMIFATLRVTKVLALGISVNDRIFSALLISAIHTPSYFIFL